VEEGRALLFSQIRVKHSHFVAVFIDGTDRNNYMKRSEFFGNFSVRKRVRFFGENVSNEG